MQSRRLGRVLEKKIITLHGYDGYRKTEFNAVKGFDLAVTKNQTFQLFYTLRI